MLQPFPQLTFSIPTGTVVYHKDTGRRAVVINEWASEEDAREAEKGGTVSVRVDPDQRWQEWDRASVER